MCFFKLAAWSAAVAAVVAAGSISAVVADDFRIHTRVFRADELDFESQNTTVFRNGVVYDFQAEPAKVAIFDRPRGQRPGRFVLLDPVAKRQTEVAIADVQQFTERLVGWTAGRDDKLLNFLSAPKFETSFDSDTGQWSFESPYINYQVKSAPSDSVEQFQQFDEFADWMVRLNTMTLAKSQPPLGLARLAVNASLREKQQIPVEVVLEIESDNRLLKNRLKYRTEHQLSNLLPQSDLTRIEQVGVLLQTLPEVSLEEYLTPMTLRDKTPPPREPTRQ